MKEAPIPAEEPRQGRKPRWDAQRNRDQIVRAAKVAFTEHGANASLDDIAKNAEVGSATLYRHFPTREALLEAVYHAEVDKLADSAEQFGRELPPLEALQAWLRLFIDYLATKKIIAAALHNLVGAPSNMFDESLSRVHSAVLSIFGRAVAAGEIRADVNPVDVLRAIVGVTFFGPSDNWKDGAIRLMDILIQGSRPS